MTDCPFCAPNWPNLTILKRIDWGDGLSYAVIRPLDPVTDGHVLVICATHTTDAADDTLIAAEAMDVAAAWVRDNAIEANIITSIGRNATQTVMHLHVHVVPRRPHDGLPLPWTPQHEVKSLEKAVHLKTMLQESGGDSRSVGLFQQSSSTGYQRRGQGQPSAIEQEDFERRFHERQGRSAKFNVLKASRGEDPWEN